jgi:hypothetical protein
VKYFMKMIKLIIPVLLLAAGCGKWHTQVITPSSIKSVSLQGHEYIVYQYQGGIIHSESCTNAACQPITLEKLRNPMNLLVPTLQGADMPHHIPPIAIP